MVLSPSDQVQLNALPPRAFVPRPRVVVIQDGARLHYAVPRALAQAGLLERMFSEWFVTPDSAQMLAARTVSRIAPAVGRGLPDRSCPDIPPGRTSTHPLLAIYLRLARRRFSSQERYYDWCSERVARWVRSAGWGKADTLFGFVRNIHPRLCEAARRDGLAVVVDQMITPAVIERDQLRLEQTRWPGWEPEDGRRDFALVDQVERRTWTAAHHLTCASDYVRKGLVGCGVPAHKITVIPYPIASAEFAAPDRSGRTGPITVGFVGHVGLRKGAPYFAAVARRLAGRGLRFVMVGPVNVGESARLDLTRWVELTGPVPRSRVRAWLSEFDLFLFPSTCEGSAGSVMEAMAAGLPVVTSPNSGALVKDGSHGFVREYTDVDGMAEVIDRLAASSTLRQEMARTTLVAARECNLAAYGRQLTAVFALLAGEQDDGYGKKRTGQSECQQQQDPPQQNLAEFPNF